MSWKNVYWRWNAWSTNSGRCSTICVKTFCSKNNKTKFKQSPLIRLNGHKTMTIRSWQRTTRSGKNADNWKISYQVIPRSFQMLNMKFHCSRMNQAKRSCN
jgi:hypothetical protein